MLAGRKNKVAANWYYPRNIWGPKQPVSCSRRNLLHRFRKLNLNRRVPITYDRVRQFSPFRNALLKAFLSSWIHDTRMDSNFEGSSLYVNAEAAYLSTKSITMFSSTIFRICVILEHLVAFIFTTCRFSRFSWLTTPKTKIVRFRATKSIHFLKKLF